MITIKRRIYLASSWRNEQQPALVAGLREDGHEVYDFRNPAPGVAGFSWDQAGYSAGFVDKGDRTRDDLDVYLEALSHPKAQRGFSRDMTAMQWADTLVLLLPCGRSAHLEAGWAIGAGKQTHIILSPQGFEPELMYLLADRIHADMDAARAALRAS